MSADQANKWERLGLQKVSATLGTEADPGTAELMRLRTLNAKLFALLGEWMDAMQHEFGAECFCELDGDGSHGENCPRFKTKKLLTENRT